MKLIEFKRKDGKPLYCWPEAVSPLMESTEEPGHARVWISGQQFTLGDTVEQAKRKLTEATL